MIYTTDLIKNSSAYKILKRDILGGSNSAYIIVSSDDRLISDFFKIAGQLIYCANQNACGVCDECKKVANNNNPDLFFFGKDKKPIKVDTIKDVVDEVYVKPLSGKKVIMIENAELMNTASQNKLLKTLEEPPTYACFFLGTKNESMLLGTIKSRCKILHIDLFSTDDIMSVLTTAGIDRDKAQIASSASQGLVYKAYEIASNDDSQQTYLRAIEFLTNLNKSGDIINFSFDKKSDDIGDFLDVLSIITRDIMMFKTCPDQIRSKHQLENIKILSAKFSPKALSSFLLHINKARYKLNYGVNALAVMDALMFSLLEEKFKWKEL